MSTTEPRTLTCAKLAEMAPPPPATRYYADTLEVGLIDGSGCDWYRVDLERVNSASDLLAWLHHLADKTWITTRHLKELIDHAATQRGIRINYGC